MSAMTPEALKIHARDAQERGNAVASIAQILLEDELATETADEPRPLNDYTRGGLLSALSQLGRQASGAGEALERHLTHDRSDEGGNDA